MKVTVHSSITIAQTDHNSSPWELPLTIFDRFALNFHTGYLLAFTPPTPTNAEIIQALCKTLHHFPSLSGQLIDDGHRRPCIQIDGKGTGGTLLVEATVSSNLQDHLPLEPSPDLLLLHPSIEVAQHLLQVQLNRFACGGLVIGFTVHHRVADGQSVGSFLVAWAEMARGMTITTIPNYDQSLLAPRRPPTCEFEHRGYEFLPLPEDHVGFPEHPTNVEPEKIQNILLHYSPEFIGTKLKLSNKFTTFEVLLGYLWRKISIARGLDGEEQTLLSISVNGRRRLSPPVTREYFGNLVVAAYPKAKVQDLIEGGVEAAARIIQEAIRRTGDDYFRSFVDFGEIHGDEELVPVFEAFGNVLSPNMEADSWLGLGFDKVDFGGGGALRAVMPTWIPCDGLLIFLPSLRGDGGVDVVVTLVDEHADKLRGISHSMD